MQDAILALLMFIAQNSQMDIPEKPLVHIVLVEPETLSIIASPGHGGLYANKKIENHERLQGLYHHKSQTIYLNTHLDLDTYYSQSVLLHELVHYLQDYNGLYAASICKSALETKAYELQNLYLAQHDVDIQFDAAFVKNAVGFCADYI